METAINMKAFHEWLRGACPAHAGTLLHELVIGHKASPAGYSGLPRKSAELANALTGLAIKGLVKESGSGHWCWLTERPKAEPQKALF